MDIEEHRRRAEHATAVAEGSLTLAAHTDDPARIVDLLRKVLEAEAAALDHVTAAGDIEPWDYNDAIRYRNLFGQVLTELDLLDITEDARSRIEKET